MEEMMSILSRYKKNVESQPEHSAIDSITFYVLLSQTKDMADKKTVLDYLYHLENKKIKELLEYNQSFMMRKPYSLERELTTIKFLIASVEM